MSSSSLTPSSPRLSVELKEARVSRTALLAGLAAEPVLATFYLGAPPARGGAGEVPGPAGGAAGGAPAPLLGMRRQASGGGGGDTPAVTPALGMQRQATGGAGAEDTPPISRQTTASSDGSADSAGDFLDHIHDLVMGIGKSAAEHACVVA